MSEKPIFRPLDADDPDPEVTEIESLCMNCEQNGTTKLLLTKIPFYKEVVLMSFNCEHCGYENNEIQPGGSIEEKGIKIRLNVTNVSDLNRQIIKSDFAAFKIPHLDFEIPSQSQKGEITTLEGIIDKSIRNIEEAITNFNNSDPEKADKLRQFVLKLLDLKSVESPFVIVLEDISGKSFISNPNSPMKDSNLHVTNFVRNREQNHLLGVYTQEEVNDEATQEVGIMPIISRDDFSYEDLDGSIEQFRTNCPACNAACFTNMKMTDIPHFKEVIIMSTSCDVCGERTNEIKSGGGIEELGTRIEVTLAKPEDLTRDILKSETCQLEIPEIKLEVGPRALSGRFTTVEGLLSAMKDQLIDSSAMFSDSQDDETKVRFKTFLEKVEEIRCCRYPVTLILDDPAGNSYAQKMTDEGPDPGLKISKYERTFEQNEELGINDMKTENYETEES